jgi:hypothetical protein
MITDNYGSNSNTNTRKTEELFAIFLTNPARYVSGRKLDNQSVEPAEHHAAQGKATKVKERIAPIESEPVVVEKPAPHRYVYQPAAPLPREQRQITIKDLSPEQRAGIELACFEAKAKGQFFFNDCMRRKAAAYESN